MNTRNIISLEKRQELKSKFYQEREITDSYSLSLLTDTREIIGYIYVIENITDGKKYVGKTTSIKTRPSDYIREYIKNIDGGRRPITRAMISEGIDKFIMYPIAKYDDHEIGAMLERHFIDKLNVIDPKCGYNILRLSSIASTSPSNINGTKHTAEMKFAKSKFMAAYNSAEKKIIFSSGLKLFADHIGSTKDYIKNIARRQSLSNGYFVIYLKPEDMKMQLDAVTERMDAYGKRESRVHKEYLERPKLFLDACNKVSQVILSKEIPEDFEVICIMQDSESKTGYSTIDLSEFLYIMNRSIGSKYDINSN